MSLDSYADKGARPAGCGTTELRGCETGNVRAGGRRSADFKELVGAEGFEPPTLWSQTRCATRLRYAPTPPIIPRQSAAVYTHTQLTEFADRPRRAGALAPDELAARSVLNAPGGPEKNRSALANRARQKPQPANTARPSVRLHHPVVPRGDRSIRFDRQRSLERHALAPHAREHHGMEQRRRRREEVGDVEERTAHARVG